MATESGDLPIQVGVDTGGTFTDLVIALPGGVRVIKLPSTPRDPSEAFAAAVSLASEGLPVGELSITHGTTVATNALLQRRGSRTAFLASTGFRDLLEIGRQTRNELYSLHPTRPVPLVPRELAFDVTERTSAEGEVLSPLDEQEVERLLDRLGAQHVESLAVCFLFSFLRPEHERRVGELARRRGFSVSLSHEVLPEYREYERASTTCANAYVAPLMDRYLGRLQSRLVPFGTPDLRVMQSNGGAISAATARRHPVRTVLSGPAAGVVAAGWIGRQAGFDRILAFDMGGTSTDVSFIDGEALLSTEGGSIDGIPIRTPMLDIHTIGAGGGSLATVGPGGAFRVGPESAGADPGPACYGRGERPTVTDANLLLGRLGDAPLLAGAIPLQRERALQALARLGAELRCTPEQAALGVLEVVNAGMGRALRKVSIERGQDPRGDVLLAFGGSGPLHACELADLLEMRTVLVPRYPGAFSALGLLLSDLRREFSRTVMQRFPRRGFDPSALESHMEMLVAEAKAAVLDEGLPADDWTFKAYADTRYAGQSYEILTPLPEGGWTELPTVFDALHRKQYGTSLPEADCEVVNVRIRATGRRPQPLLQHTPARDRSPAVPLRVTEVADMGGRHVARLYDRAHLEPGASLVGPAIVLQADSTTWLPSGWRAEADEWYNLLVTRQGPL